MSDSVRVNMEKKTPTVVPQQFFLPGEDAAILRKAMKGIGTDEKKIIKVLAQRSNAQRLQIIGQFQKEYNKDLIKELKSELSGNFRKLVVALMTPFPQFYAKELHHAMAGIGTNEDVLIEVLTTLSNSEIGAIKSAYHQKYKRPLTNDIKSDTSGYFKSLLTTLCEAKREENVTTDPEKAKEDAKRLYEAGESRWGTDESIFNKMLCRRNYAQLKLIFEKYNDLAGHGIEKAIESEFSGDVEDALLAIVKSIQNKPAFFAEKLHKSVKGLGTNDRNLTRIVVTRCEIDMSDIKREYETKFSTSVAGAIKDDCSGDYKNCLLALIGEF